MFWLGVACKWVYIEFVPISLFFYKCLCDMKIAPLRLGKGAIDSEGEEAVISEPLRLLCNRVRG